MIVWKNDSDTIILKPIEIRSKRGVKKTKKTNSAIYIPNMDAKEFDKICAEKGLQFIYTQVQPHGRLIDADAQDAQIEALIERHMHGYTKSTWDFVCELRDILKHNRTIITADPEEEEMK